MPKERWGLCTDCDRWFYVGAAEEEAECPVCALAPARIEERSTDVAKASPPAAPGLGLTAGLI